MYHMSFTGLFKSIDGNGIHANIVKTSQSTKVSQNIGRSNVITLACCMKFTKNLSLHIGSSFPLKLYQFESIYA